MNKAKLKTYAPQARKDFIAAVTARANQLGLSEKAGSLDVLPAERQGDVTLIAGREWPATVHAQRERLIRRLRRDGFSQTLEAVAYTWFNRIAALRFMELHDYLGHGHRVLSSTAGGLPDILAHAASLAANKDLPGLNADFVAELTLAGNKDGELYRLLLVAQCNALSAAMPFLFERIDDETELLLPDNLLRTDSILAQLVEAIPEEDWQQVEIIGWLYQFYISEKKDQVIGKVVKSEDIPAATQLFTPNWIVQYLVQNSVGRLWLMANPTSTLKAEWPYYIEPAEQTPEVNAQLDALIQARMAEDGDSLNPESITVLDPACGSGHILVEAYALLKGIYLERGYRLRDIPRLILEKNLYGLDIDDRAAQLAGFGLLMKARADDRRLFNDPPRLKVLSLQESKGLELDELANHLVPFGVQRGTVKALLDSFEHAKTFGSLIQIPDVLNAQLPALVEALGKANETGDLYAQAAAQDVLLLVEQAQVLGRKFDAVVANPPYMGFSYFDPLLKDFVERVYQQAKSDLYACFICRGVDFSRDGAFGGYITIPNWMSLTSFDVMRSWLYGRTAIQTFSHNGRGVFGSDFGTCAFTFISSRLPDYVGLFKRLFDRPGSVNSNESIEKSFIVSKAYKACVKSFEKIPGKPVAYWVGDRVAASFDFSASIGSVAKKGLSCSGTEKYYRFFWEISLAKMAGFGGKKWFRIMKGGPYRKWFGNDEYCINWEDSGQAIKKEKGAAIRNESYYFREACSWNDVTNGPFSCRFVDSGAIPTDSGPAIFDSRQNLYRYAAVLNSSVAPKILDVLCQTIHFGVGQIAKFPIPDFLVSPCENVERLIEISRWDWNDRETAPGFLRLWLSNEVQPHERLADTWIRYEKYCLMSISELKEREEENSRLLVSAYGLQGEISPDISENEITLTRADRAKDSQRLISYAIGCMMGRYSLDEPGLIYAHAGNVGFDATRYQTFRADADGIVPITDELWFEDEAAHRVREFLRAVWGADTLDENMAWLAESLGAKAGETPDETIRRYLADKFFKDHLQTYKKRPIYWLFSSGKQGAFQALVYLHRYHEGTLARLRAEYVVPLTGKLQARIERLERDASAASSAAARTKLNKAVEKLRKKHVELLAYDEKLRHHADLRIQLDLDDGVKMNYGKFGDLLAEVKSVTGGAADD